MASFKKMLISVLFLLVMAALGVGGTMGYFRWQQYQAQRDLERAQGLLAQNDAPSAKEVLQGLFARTKPNSAWAASLVEAQFKTLAQLGDSASAASLAQQVLAPGAGWVQPGQPAWAQAHGVMMQQALKTQDLAGVREHAQALLDQPATSPELQTEAKIAQARVMMAEGRVPEAQQALSALHEAMAEGDAGRDAVEHALGMCNMTLLMSRQPYGDDQIYSIQKGDTIYGIARKFKVAQDLIMGVNHISEAGRLTIGQRLKIPDLDLSIVVNKTDNTLTLLNHGKFFKKYRVRTGEFDYMTPVGEFKITNKKIDPAWNNPKDHKTYPPGDPGNQLGCRWMGFQGSNLGIHEAIDPETIGKYASTGCVGMLRDDVIELFNLARVNTPVSIVGQQAKP